MATEQREEGVTCSICLDVLVRPLVLQCQHVVCRPCFLDYLEANAKHPYQQGWSGGGAVCPLGRCEIPFAVPPINTTLQYLVETRHPKDVQDRVAALPPADKEATRAHSLVRRHGLLSRRRPPPQSPFDDGEAGDDGLLSECADCMGGRDPLGGSTCAGPTLLAFVFGVLLLYNALPSVRRHDEFSAAKPVWATRQRFSGMDFGCGDDSEGESRAACQIRCGTPCIEPFLQCQLHAQCHAVWLNAEGSFGTLKRGIPQLGPLWPLTHARKCHSRREWRAWLGESAETEGPIHDADGAEASLDNHDQAHSSGPGLGPPSTQHAQAAQAAQQLQPQLPPRQQQAARPQVRAVGLALAPVAGRDFRCAESDGVDPRACQVRCGGETCVEAWRRCVALPRCGVLSMNSEWSWATLKLDAAASASNASVGGAPTQRRSVAEFLRGPANADVLAAHGGELLVQNETEWVSLHSTARRVAQRAGRHHAATAQLAMRHSHLERAQQQPTAAARSPDRLSRPASAPPPPAVTTAPLASGAAAASVELPNATVAMWAEAFAAVGLRKRRAGGAAGNSSNAGDNVSAAGSASPAAPSERVEEPPRAHRPVMLAIEDVKDHDFACAEHQGANAEACQVSCDDEACVAAYRRCLAHAACVAVHVNGERTFGTLKEGIQDGQEIIAVLSEAEWLQQMRPQLEEQWHKHHRTSTRQHAMLPGPGAPHAAPYWRLQPHAAAPGLFSLLGGL